MPPLTPQLRRECEQAIHVIKANGEVLKAGRASMFILETIGYPRWLVRPLTGPLLVWFTELGYYLVANNRGFFSKFMFTKSDS